jgi:hypothetical protein
LACPCELLKIRRVSKNSRLHHKSRPNLAGGGTCIRATGGPERSPRQPLVSAHGCEDEDHRKFENRRASIGDEKLTTAFSAFPVRRLWKICSPQNEDSMAAAIADSEVPAQSGPRASTSKTILIRSAASFAAANFFNCTKVLGLTVLGSTGRFLITPQSPSRDRTTASSSAKSSSQVKEREQRRQSVAGLSHPILGPSPAAYPAARLRGRARPGTSGRKGRLSCEIRGRSTQHHTPQNL